MFMQSYLLIIIVIDKFSVYLLSGMAIRSMHVTIIIMLSANSPIPIFSGGHRIAYCYLLRTLDIITLNCL